MAQEQVTVSACEIKSLAIRNQQLHNKFTRADIKCHRFTEDLVAAKAKLDQLCNESANLCAEKKIREVSWPLNPTPLCMLKISQNVQTRLVEEN